MSIPKVHTSYAAILSVLEAYQRRSDNNNGRVIGSLYGLYGTDTNPTEKSSSTSYNIRIDSGMLVPHSEFGDQISINSEMLKRNNELHRRMVPYSFSVGWFCIQKKDGLSAFVPSNTDFIREYFIREAFSANLPWSVFMDIILSAEGVVIKTFLLNTSQPDQSYVETPFLLECGVPEKLLYNTILSQILADKSTVGNTPTLISLPTFDETLVAKTELKKLLETHGIVEEDLKDKAVYEQAFHLVESFAKQESRAEKLFSEQY